VDRVRLSASMPLLSEEC